MSIKGREVKIARGISLIRSFIKESQMAKESVKFMKVKVFKAR